LTGTGKRVATIGAQRREGDAGRGHLAQPNAAREIVNLLLEALEERAPLAATQLRAGLDAPIGTPPPDGGTRFTLVVSAKKAA
jgi:hypothetical protein